MTNQQLLVLEMDHSEVLLSIHKKNSQIYHQVTQLLYRSGPTQIIQINYPIKKRSTKQKKVTKDFEPEIQQYKTQKLKDTVNKK